ncbi:hypothetical protein PR048_021723 [Dryococelus australis]|uniref:Zinc finger PHD-type domain-containing protein n=1 Tax=Dryococelus australis TaxID=614101 RepID=A0ABQ9GYZ3_9NEOP|nr:hypothetical protein PR048_021723 [Dryococelus australis]
MNLVTQMVLEYQYNEFRTRPITYCNWLTCTGKGVHTTRCMICAQQFHHLCIGWPDEGINRSGLMYQCEVCRNPEDYSVPNPDTRQSPVTAWFNTEFLLPEFGGRPHEDAIEFATNVNVNLKITKYHKSNGLPHLSFTTSGGGERSSQLQANKVALAITHATVFPMSIRSQLMEMFMRALMIGTRSEIKVAVVLEKVSGQFIQPISHYNKHAAAATEGKQADVSNDKLHTPGNKRENKIPYPVKSYDRIMVLPSKDTTIVFTTRENAAGQWIVVILVQCDISQLPPSRRRADEGAAKPHLHPYRTRSRRRKQENKREETENKIASLTCYPLNAEYLCMPTMH